MHISIRTSFTLFVTTLVLSLITGCQNEKLQTNNTENSTEEKELTPEEIRLRDIDLYVSDFSSEQGLRDRVRKYITHRYDMFTPIVADKKIAIQAEPISTICATDFSAFDTIIFGDAIYNVDPSRNSFQKIDIETGTISSPINTESARVLMGLTERDGLITLCSSDKIFFYNTESDSTTSIPNSYNLVYACPVGEIVLGTGGFGFPEDSPSNWFISYHSRETGALVVPEFKIDTTSIETPRFTGRNRPTTKDTLHFACSEDGIAICNHDNVNSVVFLQTENNTIIAQKTVDISGLIPDLSEQFTVSELEELASPPIISHSSLDGTTLNLVYNSYRLTQAKHFLVTKDVLSKNPLKISEIELPIHRQFEHQVSNLMAAISFDSDSFVCLLGLGDLGPNNESKDAYLVFKIESTKEEKVK